MLNVTVPVKVKDAFALVFDQVFIQATRGKSSFLAPHVGSKYKLAALSGIVLHIVPGEMVIRTIKTRGGRDVILALNFFAIAEGTKIVANLINVPSSAAGDEIIKEIEDELGSIKDHFGPGAREPRQAEKRTRRVAKPAEAKAEKATTARPRKAVPAKAKKTSTAKAKRTAPARASKAVPVTAKKAVPAKARKAKRR
jgi:hypothetical protein